MDTPKKPPFMARVRAALPEFHPSERRLADLVLDFPGDIAGYTATELSGLAEVSNATVSRFVRKIGYASYDEARRAVRDEQQEGAALLRFGSQAGGQGEGRPSPVAAHFEQSQANLQRSYEGIDPTELDGLAAAMLTAPHLWLAGFRAAHPLAQYLGWQVRQVLPRVSLLPKAGETLAESVAAIGEGDVVILVALRRAPRIALRLAEAVAAPERRLAIIGDVPDLDRRPARWRFACATSSPGPLLNHVGAMALCNLIAGRVIDLSGAAGRARMLAVEEAHGKLDEL